MIYFLSTYKRLYFFKPTYILFKTSDHSSVVPVKHVSNIISPISWRQSLPLDWGQYRNRILNMPTLGRQGSSCILGSEIWGESDRSHLQNQRNISNRRLPFPTYRSQYPQHCRCGRQNIRVKGEWTSRAYLECWCRGPSVWSHKWCFEIHMQINYITHWLLAHHLIPVLLSTARNEVPGSVRIVCVASIASDLFGTKKILYEVDEIKNKGNYNRYGLSKLANVLHAKNLNDQYGPKASIPTMGRGRSEQHLFTRDLSILGSIRRFCIDR